MRMRVASAMATDGERVDVQVKSDEETITVTVQSVITGWSVEQLQVYYGLVIA